MPKEPTPEQSRASRANGLKSRAAKTPRGKTRSSLNRLKQGLRAHSLILPNENRADYNELADSLHRHYRPANPPLIPNFSPREWPKFTFEPETSCHY